MDARGVRGALLAAACYAAGEVTAQEPAPDADVYDEAASHPVFEEFAPRIFVAPPRATLRNLPGSFDLTALDSRILVQGPREHIRRLSEIGTVVFVPTHLSNLDSVVFGFAIERAGLPPAVYGAGKNLFTNPVLSYFMHNLGAYRVDRRLRAGLDQRRRPPVEPRGARHVRGGRSGLSRTSPRSLSREQ